MIINNTVLVCNLLKSVFDLQNYWRPAFCIFCRNEKKNIQKR